MTVDLSFTALLIYIEPGDPTDWYIESIEVLKKKYERGPRVSSDMAILAGVGGRAACPVRASLDEWVRGWADDLILLSVQAS